MATKKKVTAKKTTARKPKVVPLQSFRPGKDVYPFMSIRVTDQTVYWTILLVMVLLLGLCVVNIQISISDILYSIKI